jgi:hypothetical protein
MDPTGGRRSADTTSGSGKGKGKMVLFMSASEAESQSPSSNTGALSEQTVPPKKKRRLVHGDGSSIMEPALQGQQTPRKATVGQVRGSSSGGHTAKQADTKKATVPPLDPNATVKKVVTAMGSSGSGGGGFAAVQADAEKAASAKEAMMVTTTKEVVAAVAAKEAMAAAVTKEAMTAAVAKEAMAAAARADVMPDPKAAVEKTVMTKLSGAGSGRPGAVQADATPDSKVAAKRPAAMTGSGGSSPPRKCFCGSWRYAILF